MRTKACRTCGETKYIRDFYRHSASADGHYSQCKSCHCAENAENKRLKAEYYAAWRRQHLAKPEVKQRYAEQMRQYRRSPRGKALMEEAKRFWQRMNPEKHAQVQREAQARYRLKRKQVAA